MSAWSSRLLPVRWRMLGDRLRIANEFSALVSFLTEKGCTFHRCSDLGTRPVPRGVSFRYDVHVRDLDGAFAFAALHRRHGIPASFFVLWDYSPLERSRLGDFLKLNGCLASPLEIGLHDSPVDSYLIAQKFGGDRKLYAAWLGTADAVAWFSRLGELSDELEQLNGAALEGLKLRVEKTRTLFGPIKTIAAHGGEIGQTWRKRMTMLGPSAAVVRSFFGRHWLTRERVLAAGLEAAVDCYGDFATGWKELACGGGAITLLSKNLRHHLLLRNSAVQLLLHPYTWTGATRDADLRQALFAETQ